MAMIRKQLYLEASHQTKLTRLAARWGCTEAAVVRRALDLLPEGGDPLEERLRAAGLLVPPPEMPHLPEGTDVAVLEREWRQWLQGQPPLGLSEAVLEDRR